MDDRSRTSARDIRRRNRSILLSKLFFDAPLSRLELAQLTGLSGATVSNLTGELVDERLIVPVGQVESDGGRPRVMLRVDPRYGYLVGADVGETGVKVELFDLAMERRGEADLPLAGERPTPAEVADHVVAGLARVLGAAGVQADQVIGIGVAVPGMVERGESIAVHAPTIGWQAVPLERLLRERGVTAPVFVDNGAKAQGRAEMWFGAGRGARHAVVALVGSGVGAAVINDGAAYRGAGSTAGEWGHTTLVYGGRECRCGARGCLEAYVGAGAVVERHREVGGGLAGDDQEAAIAALLADPSAEAERVLAETADYLGAGIANLINLFNPERVVLGGWAGLLLGPRLLPRIREAAERQALAFPFGQVTVEMGSLGSDAVAFGAAMLPLEALLGAGADPRR
ncbi:ROK family transcriptional regulator [Kitasatospora terrestris]|uniref:ROK family transcriptional regulator n=1 Tax=Kitasatospora terrestris TaxID=258051 RepID=A0ABP9DUA7_9ACTN